MGICAYWISTYVEQTVCVWLVVFGMVRSEPGETLAVVISTVKKLSFLNGRAWITLCGSSSMDVLECYQICSLHSRDLIVTISSYSWSTWVY